MTADDSVWVADPEDGSEVIPREEPRNRAPLLLKIVVGLLVLMALLEFNPFHPIWWADRFVSQIEQGWHTGGTAKVRDRCLASHPQRPDSCYKL